MLSCLSFVDDSLLVGIRHLHEASPDKASPLQTLARGTLLSFNDFLVVPILWHVSATLVWFKNSRFTVRVEVWCAMLLL
jgi:hypothetical protein